MIKKIFIAIFLVALVGIVFAFYRAEQQKQEVISEVRNEQTQKIAPTVTPTPAPTTESAVQAILAEKYNKPLSDVQVTVKKEVPGYAYGSVLFGQGGPGEGGMWIAVDNNGWSIVWDGNGNVDCAKMRQDYSIPDTILKPDLCN